MSLKDFTTKDNLVIVGVVIFAIYSIYQISKNQLYTNILLIIMAVIILGISWSIKNDLDKFIVKR